MYLVIPRTKQNTKTTNALPLRLKLAVNQFKASDCNGFLPATPLLTL